MIHQVGQGAALENGEMKFADLAVNVKFDEIVIWSEGEVTVYWVPAKSNLFAEKRNCNKQRMALN